MSGEVRRRSEPSRGLKLAVKLTQGRYDEVMRARVESWRVWRWRASLWVDAWGGGDTVLRAKEFEGWCFVMGLCGGGEFWDYSRKIKVRWNRMCTKGCTVNPSVAYVYVLRMYRRHYRKFEDFEVKHEAPLTLG
jgi:hypothetical protein